MHYDVRSQRGYGVRTEPRDGDGELIYRLVLPDGMAAPLPHVEPPHVANAANKR